MSLRRIPLKLGIMATAYAVGNCTLMVDVGERALIANRCSGLKNEMCSEGMHFKLPFIETPIIFDTRANPEVHQFTSMSLDLHEVKISVRALIQPVADQLPILYRTLGKNYIEKVLALVIDETLNSVVAKYSASQLITQRESFVREIREIMTEKTAYFNIKLVDVSISTTFGKEFTAAAEAAQVAAQEAESAKFMVEKAKRDRRSSIIRAQGDAKSAQLIGDVISNHPELIALAKIEASKAI